MQAPVRGCGERTAGGEFLFGPLSFSQGSARTHNSPCDVCAKGTSGFKLNKETISATNAACTMYSNVKHLVSYRQL